MPAPTRYYVVYRNAVPMLPGDEDGDLERFYSQRDFRSLSAARRWAQRECKWALINERTNVHQVEESVDYWLWDHEFVEEVS